MKNEITEQVAPCDAKKAARLSSNLPVKRKYCEI